MSFMVKPSKVAITYDAFGMFARDILARNAATPALVWVKINAGLGPVCSAKVSAMSCVFPHPAGAVTEPRWNAKILISGGMNPIPNPVDDRLEAWVRIR